MDEVVKKQNRFLRKVVSLSAAGVFLDGYDLFIISVALIYVESQNWLAPSTLGAIQLGLLQSSALIGMFFGALFLGRFADRVGRRTLYVIDLIFFVFFGFLTALATNINELIVFRLLLGIGIGADYPISSTYVAEFSPKQQRGRLVTRTFMFWGIGSLIAAVVGFTVGRFEYVNLFGMQVATWRIMLASGVVPAIAVLFLRHTMPESPRWLLANSKVKQANEIIEQIRDKYGLDYSKDLASVEPERRGKVSELFNSAYRKRTMFAWIPWFFMDIGVYGVGISIPLILEKVGFGGTSIQDKVHAILGTIVLDVVVMVGFFVALMVIEKLGRLRLQEIGFLGMAVGALIFALTFGHGIYVMMIVLAAYQFFENVGPNLTTWIVPTEIFPTRLRATAQGTSSAFSRLGAVFGTLMFPVFELYYGWNNLFILVFVFMLLGALFTWMLGTEAKGLSLEDSSIVFLEFSKYLEKLGEKVTEGANELVEMTSKYDNLHERAERIRRIEHEADGIVHEIYTKVNHMQKPLESVDVGNLATKYDDILDFINAVAKRISLFKVEKTKVMDEFSSIILEAVIEVNKALNMLGNFTNSDMADILKETVRINELENKADDMLEDSYNQIFAMNDAIKLLKLKEIYEYMESVTDKCEDVSDIFMDLVIKYS
ncbi:MAG: MFS transporter [Thermoplasmatales archaeon]|nr:MFS transporter [Candidatus Thermoplasmatota archaeon]MDA8054857.1 MFS transporter [Thermoplasmatales archaeon]